MQKIENTCKFRSQGLLPPLPAAAVITIGIGGEFFKLHEDSELYSYHKDKSQRPPALSKPPLSEAGEPYGRSLSEYAKRQQTTSITTTD